MQRVATEVAEIGHRLLRALKRALTITNPYTAYAGAFAGPSICAFIGGSAILTWATALEPLMSLVAAPLTTAFCFGMSLSSLWLWWTARKSVSKLRAARLCGSLVALAGLLTLSQYLAGWDIPIWPFRDESGSPLYLSRMSFNHALCFT